MRRIPALAYLAAALLAFWLLLATMMIISGFPFIVVTLTLSSDLMISIFVLGLAWAYQKNL
ncbi:hypothetical protein [Thermogemmatispora carboxidivorans]|uniref:hypothetical protein n=1 Tax=Thermogemmatispora carboxidivorans TaxID=1382306 RepID=UPI00069C881E|nr:hypothetical protein [Thermogemmatispora carboxidivorans]